MGEEWVDRRYDFSYSAIEKKLARVAFSKPKEITLGGTGQRCVTAILSSIFGHQFLYLLQGYHAPTQTFTAKLNHIWGATWRGTQYSIVLFGTKVISDYLCSLGAANLTEYQRGGIVGLVTYLINRPLDQVETARRMILLDENRKIYRFEGFRVVLKHDGFAGLYKSENLLGPGSAVLHRSVYFGLFNRLNEGSSFPQAAKITLFSLAASIGASTTSFLIDKLRSVYLFVHNKRNTAVLKRGKIIELQESVTKQVLGMFLKGEISITRNDLKTAVVSILRNWVLLSMFQCGERCGVPFLFGKKQKSE